MAEALRPTGESALADALREARDAGTPLEIRGGGTRAGLGRPVQAERTLETGGLSGISLYEPGALTLIVAAGTPLAEVEAALAAEGQRLPFEPIDHRPLLGSEGEPTIGGVVACGVSGSRRIQAGACRDSMIGVRFVDGSGRVVANGGRVMKNVTGYDLVKLICGSYGTLGVVTQVAFKLLPVPEAGLTLAIEGLSDEDAVAVMAIAMSLPYDISGAAHLPAGTLGDTARTLLRVEGMEAQAAYRARQVEKALAEHGAITRIEGDDHEETWRRVRNVEPFAGPGGAVWRLSLRPSDACGVVRRLRREREVEAIYDWAGGLVWLRTPETDDAGAAAIRRETAGQGGHATLMRATPATRAAVPVFEPEPEPLRRISEGLRRKFDPAGILNPQRMAG